MWPMRKIEHGAKTRTKVRFYQAVHKFPAPIPGWLETGRPPCPSLVLDASVTPDCK